MKILNKFIFGGNVLSYLNKSEASKILKLSYENGINQFDTADVYGDGFSEESIGDFVKSNRIPRDKVKLYSKAGTKFIDQANGLYTKINLHKKVDSSLSRLKTDYIDLYQLHNFDNTTPLSEIFETLSQIKKSGKIKEFGVSNFKESHLKSIKIYLNDIFSNQVNINIINQNNLFLSKYTKLIAYGVLGRGLLRDKIEDSIRYKKSISIRNDINSKDFQNSYEILRRYSKKYGYSILDIALNFMTSKKNVYKVIIAYRNRNQLEKILKSISKKIEKSFFNSISSELNNLNIREKILGNFL